MGGIETNRESSYKERRHPRGCRDRNQSGTSRGPKESSGHDVASAITIGPTTDQRPEDEVGNSVTDERETERSFSEPEAFSEDHSQPSEDPSMKDPVSQDER